LDYVQLFQEIQIDENPAYPQNDIGIASLFYDLHKYYVRYVMEAKTWYVFDGRRWAKDENGFKVMEMCKEFAQSFAKYAESVNDDSDEGKAFLKYAAGFTNRKRREGILSDARSIQPMSLAEFDRNKTLLNCLNGTYNFEEMILTPHNPNDYITKLARVKYNENATCERWERFISEVMNGDADTAQFREIYFALIAAVA